MLAQIGSHLRNMRLIKKKLMILVDFTNSTAEHSGLHVNNYGYYATTTSLLRGQCKSLREFVLLESNLKNTI